MKAFQQIVNPTSIYLLSPQSFTLTLSKQIRDDPAAHGPNERRRKKPQKL
jgi:hypothetical protein